MFENQPVLNRDLLVHELFEWQANEIPENVAICSKNETITYGQAQSFSNFIAQWLTQSGVRQGDHVALSFEHSVWTPVAILAAWKVGAAVAFLPDGPSSRIETILNIINPSAMLVSKKRQSAIAIDSTRTLPRLLVEQDLFQSATTLPVLAPLHRDTSSVAYTMFTSGSTGAPKGAQIEHEQFATYVLRWAEAIGITRSSRVYGWCSYMFDVSMSDIFGTLCNGATLCVPSDDDRLNRIPQSMSELQVTHAEFVPSVLTTLHPSDVDLEHLRVVSMVGEKPTQTVVDQWASIPSLTLFNAYGPAECCPHASICNLTITKAIPSNIGHSLGPALWVVEPQTLKRIQACGEEGELLIEGTFVGRGYLGNVDQTERAFISAPSWLESLRGKYNSRLYRTGDICRYATDGTIEYVARNDGQVKINGQRMELGEVEHVLRQVLPKFADVAVVLGQKATGGSSIARLVAFLALRANYSVAHGSHGDGVSHDAEAVAAMEAMLPSVLGHLRQKLPKYMIPARFVAMDFIPRLTSGKIDRKSLGEVASRTSAAPKKSTSAPSVLLTPVEQKMRSVWASIFNVNVHDIDGTSHFFELGGDSMVALRMRSELLRTNIDLTMQAIFEHPVLADLAAIAASSETDEEAEIPSFSLLPPGQEDTIKQAAADQCQIGVDDIEDIFHAPGSSCYFMLTSEHVPTGWMLFTSFPLAADVDLGRYLKCWESVMTVFSNLRSRIIRTDSGYWQVVLKDGQEPIRHSDSLSEHFTHEQSTKMGWGQALSRYCVVTDRADNSRHFVWTASHAVHDNWSVDLVYRMVQDAYFSGNTAMSESMMTKSFIKYRMGLDIEPVKSWFHDYMDGAKPTPIFKVPAGYKFEKDTEESWTWTIPAHELRHLTHGGKKNITPSSVVSIAWALVLGHYAGSHDVTLNLIRSGRHIPLAGADEHIGGLAGYLPIRVKIDPSEEIASLLANYQQDWTKSSEFDACCSNELVGPQTSPDIRAALAAAVGINIVPAETWDNDEELEVRQQNQKQQENGGPRLMFRRSQLFPPPSAHHLGPSQNPVNVNVLLPKRQKHKMEDAAAGDDNNEDVKVGFLLRRDLKACTGEMADAFVRGVMDVGRQLLVADEGVTVADLKMPDIGGIAASAC